MLKIPAKYSKSFKQFNDPINRIQRKKDRLIDKTIYKGYK
jgi:hypothetical protein